MSIEKEFVVAVGRRWLNRQFVDRSHDEYFAWTVDDATRYSHRVAEDLADEYREAFPNVKVSVCHVDSPFTAFVPERSWFERLDDSGGLASGDED